VVKRLRDALPAAQFKLVQGASHMLPVTHRDAVNGLIAEFLDSISTQGDHHAIQEDFAGAAGRRLRAFA
jgi:hypothetical protein